MQKYGAQSESISACYSIVTSYGGRWKWELSPYNARCQRAPSSWPQLQITNIWLLKSCNNHSTNPGLFEINPWTPLVIILLVLIQMGYRISRQWYQLLALLAWSVRCHALTFFTHAIILWWRHQMETFPALLPLCAGNSPVPSEFPAQRSVTQSFFVFFDLRLNKRLNKQSWGCWFETLSRLLWRQCNGILHNRWRCICSYQGRIIS